MKRPPEEVYDTVKRHLTEIIEQLDKERKRVLIRPELMGKPSQFGTLNEILRLSAEVDGVAPCLDFAHLHARTNGAFNTEKEFRDVFENIEKSLGKSGLNNMHIHLSGIAYGEKGEKNHLILEESDMNYQDLLKVWKEYSIKGVAISESPNIEEDALLLRKIYNKI